MLAQVIRRSHQLRTLSFGSIGYLLEDIPDLAEAIAASAALETIHLLAANGATLTVLSRAVSRPKVLTCRFDDSQSFPREELTATLNKFSESLVSLSIGYHTDPLLAATGPSWPKLQELAISHGIISHVGVIFRAFPGIHTLRVGPKLAIFNRQTVTTPPKLDFLSTDIPLPLQGHVRRLTLRSPEMGYMAENTIHAYRPVILGSVSIPLYWNSENETVKFLQLTFCDGRDAMQIEDDIERCVDDQTTKYLVAITITLPATFKDDGFTEWAHRRAFKLANRSPHLEHIGLNRAPAADTAYVPPSWHEPRFMWYRVIPRFSARSVILLSEEEGTAVHEALLNLGK
ncbi:uncharacterized protein B0H18DRAFT_1117063 [Fomitopsis serialis]|uniref:uncharacterized protein n=1 Tax=Fomitopsis serialis TaxID=139415 RepID=UPI002008C113|nr:uncharacterized protein B0H18DRAFT_1117063 [Neoantrodia serialis]KAH9929990.1 hypothetical protein B0H18DRAFT_1117063 [Neoantrodia serialis]